MRAAMEANPDAVAVFINNPTYYGICSDLKTLVKLAHDHNMLALVDEAHGTHLYFGPGLPCPAMKAGADMAAVSMHKSGGSLTQSSMLLLGPKMDEGYVSSVINLTQTTSASYLLMASLDISRRTWHCAVRRAFPAWWTWRNMPAGKSTTSAVLRLRLRAHQRRQHLRF